MCAIPKRSPGNISPGLLSFPINGINNNNCAIVSLLSNNILFDISAPTLSRGKYVADNCQILHFLDVDQNCGILWNFWHHSNKRYIVWSSCLHQILATVHLRLENAVPTLHRTVSNSNFFLYFGLKKTFWLKSHTLGSMIKNPQEKISIGPRPKMGL